MGQHSQPPNRGTLHQHSQPPVRSALHQHSQPPNRSTVHARTLKSSNTPCPALPNPCSNLLSSPRTLQRTRLTAATIQAPRSRGRIPNYTRRQCTALLELPASPFPATFQILCCTHCRYLWWRWCGDGRGGGVGCGVGCGMGQHHS